MPKQHITIEVDIPDGYEATGEFRLPDESRECWLSNFSAVCEPHDGRATVHGPRLILRKKWQWPEWIKLPYIAMQPNGDWYGFSDKPSFQDGFRWDGHGFVYLLSPDYFDFTPPECTDWRQSLRKNPNAK